MNIKRMTRIAAGAIALAAVSSLLVLNAETGEAVSTPPAMTPAPGQAPGQVIDITARHGYSPLESVARADTPALLRVRTSGSFDCSSILVIPDLNYHTRLPFSGVTEIPVPPQPAGKELTGLCGMGMYRFTVNFVAPKE
jgi:plastocyanin domain-containing protein